MRASPAAIVDLARPEQSRARNPDETGFVERDGVRVFWERYGGGEPTILLMPTWSIFHARHWKLQVPDLARHFRVVTFDGRGNGRSDRPADFAAYADTEFVADALAVLDATGAGRAVVAGLSMGAGYTLRLGAEHPERALGVVLIGASLPVRDVHASTPDDAANPSFEIEQTDGDDWGRYHNAPFWRREWARWAAWFVGEKIFSEPHSTKPVEDGIAWTLETDPETIIATEYAPYLCRSAEWRREAPTEGRGLAFARRIRCPALVIHGEDDRISGIEIGRRLAAELDAPLVTIAGGGHAPNLRDPVLVNLLIREFVRGLGAAT